MNLRLTERMRDWIEGLGCHVCAAPIGVPNVVMAPLARIAGSARVAFPLSRDEVRTLFADRFYRSWVVFGVSHLGAIRAPYQFKGIAHIAYEGDHLFQLKKEYEKQVGYEAGGVLIVHVREIYCTKPGHLAGQRIDTLGYEGMVSLEKELGWFDTPAFYEDHEKY